MAREVTHSRLSSVNIILRAVLNLEIMVCARPTGHFAEGVEVS